MKESAALRETIQSIAERRGAYAQEAYVFVLEASEFVIARLGERRHVTGGTLLDGLKDLARERFGPMAKDVLNEWGVHTTLDFGRIVYHMIEAGLMSKTSEDSLADFIDKYDFQQVFEVEYFD